MNFQGGVLNFRQTPGIFQDILANRPTAGVFGRLFVDTTTPDLQRDTGDAWVSLFSGTGFVPTSRTLTIAGVTQDLSVNRTFNAINWDFVTNTPDTYGAYGIRNVFGQLGNGFAEDGVLGTNDDFSLLIRTNGITRYTISNTGTHAIVGATSITGNTGITGTLLVSGTAATGALTVTGNIGASGNLTVTGTAATGALTVTGNAGITGNLTVTGVGTINSGLVDGVALTLTGTGSGGGSTARILFQNPLANTVSIGIRDNSAVIDFLVSGTKFAALANQSFTANTFVPVAGVQTLVNLGGSIANTSGTSIGLGFALDGSASQNGYNGLQFNVADTQAFTAGNRNLFLFSFNGSSRMEMGKTGNLIVFGSITTGQPSANGAGAWKCGKYLAAAVALDATHYVEVEIDGTLRKLAIVT